MSQAAAALAAGAGVVDSAEVAALSGEAAGAASTATAAGVFEVAAISDQPRCPGRNSLDPRWRLGLRLAEAARSMDHSVEATLEPLLGAGDRFPVTAVAAFARVVGIPDLGVPFPWVIVPRSRVLARA